MDTGRFTSSTSEYPEWFLTAFAVAEPEIFALASTQAPPGTASARDNRRRISCGYGQGGGDTGCGYGGGGR